MGRYDDERGFADAINAGARFIQTDHLDKLVPYLEERDLLETRVLGRDYNPVNYKIGDMSRGNVAVNRSPGLQFST